MTRIRHRLLVAALAAAPLGVTTAAAAADPPAPCGGAAQITDPSGDGHHNNTDVLSAWFGGTADHWQAVIRVRFGSWAPEHDDSQAAGFAMLYRVAGTIRYVRAEAPRDAALRFDHGTWTRAGGFVSEGVTTGTATEGVGASVVIDVPEVAGAVAGTRVADPFVLTYDGAEVTGEPHWVDRAPGGVAPEGDEYGADVIVGGCSSTPVAGPPTGAIPGSGGDGVGPAAGTPTSVVLSAPARVTGGGRVRLSGRVVPARGGVTVAIALRGASQTRTVRATTRVDGTFAAAAVVRETTRVRAGSGSMSSRTLTIVVRATARITLRRLPGGALLVSGRVLPALPGRVLWLRWDAVTPSARTFTRAGRFRLRIDHPRRGRYQAVVIPSGNRAERATSNTGVIH